MRQRFEQQFKLGTLQICETRISTKTRDSQPKIALALLEMFNTPKYNEQLFQILEDKICGDKQKTGRPGMDLWQIFVLAMFRMGLNISYDRLHTMANNDTMLRQLLGIETESGFERESIEYQNIKDNVDLLNDDFLREIHKIILAFGNKEVFKKKATDGLVLKTDSFVVENEVHFPTDYNLLWDSARKSLSILGYFLLKYPTITGWRKRQNWHRELKILMRILGKALAGKGKNRETVVLKAATTYHQKALLLSKKIEITLKEIEPLCSTLTDLKKYLELKQFHQYLEKHIDLVERRIIKGEKIPHCDKMFSVFEPYTEWISKGKQNPNFELGKRFAITTNQFDLIEDYQMMDKVCDSEIVVAIADRITVKNTVAVWSFDKGFYSKENKEILQLVVAKVVLPKKGKCNKTEQEEEREPVFKKFRNKHSAVESNINELENRGLNRCPDKGEAHFKRYLALGVCAYNLHKIGAKILKNKLLEEKKGKLPLAA